MCLCYNNIIVRTSTSRGKIVGKRRLARLRAVEAQLSEIGYKSVQEAMLDAIRDSDTEESREIEEEYYLHRRANSVLQQITQLEMTPNEWVATQPVSIETSMLHSILAEKWEKATGRLDTSFVR